jgi:integrase
VDKRLKREFSLKEQNRAVAQNILKSYNAQQTLELLPFNYTHSAEPIKLSEVPELFFNRSRKMQRIRSVSQATKTAYIQAVNSFTNVCGDMLVNNYSVKDYNSYLHHLKTKNNINKKNFSTNTIATYTRHLYILFKFLEANSYIKKNIITMIEPEFKEAVVIPQKHLKLILDKLIERKMLMQYNLVMLAYLFGLRKNEVVAVTGDDVDLSNLLFTVRNSKGNRLDQIPILKDSVEFLQSLNLSGGKLFNYAGVDSINSFWRTTNRLCKVCYTFHSLRKTRATMLANSGISALYLQKFMRHKDIKTTLKYYVTLDLQKMRGDIDDKL